MQASFVTENPGALVSTLYASSQSIPQPQFRLGTILEGDGSSMWVFCQLVLGSTTSLTPGQLYTIDKNFVATLLATANSPRGTNVGGSQVYQLNAVAGTYYLWLQVKGHGGVAAAASSAANALSETTTTAGTANFNNTPTATTKQIKGLFLLQANQTFTATTTLNSNQLTNVPEANISDIALNAAISGTGVPGSTVITSKTRVGPNNWTLTMNNNASANGTAITITAVGVITGNFNFPFVDQTN